MMVCILDFFFFFFKTPIEAYLFVTRMVKLGTCLGKKNLTFVKSLYFISNKTMPVLHLLNLCGFFRTLVYHYHGQFRKICSLIFVQ